MAAGVEPPTQVWAHGFLTVGGKKMSKTNLTGIHPFELIDHFGVDSYRYFFMRQIAWGADGDFSWEAMVDRHNADLANGLGNLASTGARDARDQLRRGRSRRLGRWARRPTCPPSPPRPRVWPTSTCSRSTSRRPSPRCGRSSTARTRTSSRGSRGSSRRIRRTPTSSRASCTRAPRRCGSWRCLIQPLMPAAAQRLWDQLGLAGEVADQRVPKAVVWGGLPVGTATHKGDALFPRLEAGD